MVWRSIHLSLVPQNLGGVVCTETELAMENQGSPPPSQDGVLYSSDAKTLSICGQSYTKHTDHWYEDGNVGFLLVDSAFLVHRTIISRKSSVIREIIDSHEQNPMKRLPPPYVPIGPNNSMVPFFTLDDPVDDFAHVLDFIYPDSLPDARRASLTMLDLLGIVEITHNYVIVDLKRWAVETLEDEHLAVVQDEWLEPTLNCNYMGEPESCVRIILLSRRCETPQFLPLAFYALATTDWDEIPRAAACLDLLSSDDRCRIQEGHRALTKAVLAEAWEMPENGIKRVGCLTGTETCHEGWNQLWGNLGMRWKELMIHPLEELEFRFTLLQELLCSKCFKELEERTRRRRDLLLSRLCEFFRVE